VTAAVELPRPFPDPVLERFRPHFDGLRESRVLVPRCTVCGHLQWPPRVCCRVCNAEEFAWEEVPAEGTIYSYTICYRAFHPWFSARAPFGLVIADVRPDVRILGACFSPAVETLACGQAVHASFESHGAEQIVLGWEPTV
jgi:uncharacterized protein